MWVNMSKNIINFRISLFLVYCRGGERGGGGGGEGGRVHVAVSLPESTIRYLPPYFWRLSEHGDYGLARLGWSVSSRHPPIPLLVLGLQMHHGTRLLHGY